jgi:putative lipoprotein (rSAM/lipoprotein system)
MKTNYRPLIKAVNWMLAGILGLLGFSGCDDKSGLVEYGTPWADYTIKGSVINKANGKPVEGISVVVSNVPEGPALMYGVPWTSYKYLSAVTDAKGAFKLSDKGMTDYFPPDSVPLIVSDIDGEKNGSFASDTLYIDFKDAERSGKPNGWYSGEFTKTVKVELAEKKTDE